MFFSIDDSVYHWEFGPQRIRDWNIHHASYRWLWNRTAAMDANGDIRFWDTTIVTNMNNLFGPWNPSAALPGSDGSFNLTWASTFNADLSRWNTSQVTDMTMIFYHAYSFNQSLNWDTSKVVFNKT